MKKDPFYEEILQQEAARDGTPVWYHKYYPWARDVAEKKYKISPHYTSKQTFDMMVAKAGSEEKLEQIVMKYVKNDNRDEEIKKTKKQVIGLCGKDFYVDVSESLGISMDGGDVGTYKEELQFVLDSVADGEIECTAKNQADIIAGFKLIWKLMKNTYKE